MRVTDLLQGTIDETMCPYDPELMKQHQPGKVVKVRCKALIVVVPVHLFRQIVLYKRQNSRTPKFSAIFYFACFCFLVLKIMMARRAGILLKGLT